VFGNWSKESIAAAQPRVGWVWAVVMMVVMVVLVHREFDAP
jgi:hypothetical protein